MVINRAADLLNPGESAIVFFTRNMHLVINPDGSGLSGYWRISLKHHDLPDKVIIYNRPSEQAEIYMAKFVDAIDALEPTQGGRLVVRFQDAEQVGSTNRNWYEFADAGTNPVRYLSKR